LGRAGPSELRRDLVRANQIAHAVGLVTAFGHVSARLPGSDTFLIPTRASPALASSERLLLMDLEGQVLEGEGTPTSEFWIHARIYAARPDVGAAVHVHPPGCVVLSQLGETVRPLHNSAAALGPVAVYEPVGLIRSRRLGDEVAGVLGRGRAMLLRGHGANVVAADVRQAAVLACLLEEGAQLQLRALAAAGGDPSRLRFFDAAEQQLVAEQIDAAGPQARAWEYYSALASGELRPAAGEGSGSRAGGSRRVPK
jgi:ribulose-5-phosphate 4-epimerase/fuculose-1-phosphate aldolase